MWINSIGIVYEGDCRIGDRAATAEELQAWELSKQPSPLAQIKALEAEIATLKGQTQAAEQAKAAADAKVEATAQMFANLETEFKDLKSKTIGDNKPPVNAPVAQKKPSEGFTEDADKAMQEELFELAGINHLLKK